MRVRLQAARNRRDCPPDITHHTLILGGAVVINREYDDLWLEGVGVNI